MKISTYEAWLEEELQHQKRIEERYPTSTNAYLEMQHDIDRERTQLLERFPSSTVLEGHYPEHDYAVRWCWQNISPCHGTCSEWHSEYPACPLVLTTENVEHGTLKDRNGKETPWKRISYANPGEHEHEGVWCSIWLGKTDYDYGFREYCFANEIDREQFLSAFPTFTFGEKYDTHEPK